MAKKQTRRSISVRGSTYESVRAYCERHGLSMSEFIEDRIAGFFGDKPASRLPAAGSAAPQKAQARAARAKPAKRSNGDLDSDQMHDAARFFTF